VKNTNFVGDINGACADSIKHSIVTNRTTNPLQPVYSGLDCGDLLLPLIPPLIPQDLVKFPTFRKLSQERNGPGMLVCVCPYVFRFPHFSFYLGTSSKLLQKREEEFAPTLGKKALVERQTEIDLVKSLQ
jgi:hypothetical protein